MLTSVVILFSVGFVAAVILAIASQVFYVEEDPRVEAVVDVLPGANCGGCGYPGCEGYAIAVVVNPAIAANLCVAGDEKTTMDVGRLTGKAVTESDPLISVRRCEKIEGEVSKRFNYQGIPSCAGAAVLGSGLGVDTCPYSCLGLGDCIKVCPFDALSIENGIVVVDGVRCIGCGKCTHACPRNLLEIIPKNSRVMVFCSTKQKVKEVKEVCKVGCVSCSICVKKCPAKAISMKDNLVHINHTACREYGDSCQEICVSSCPRKILKSLCSTTCKSENKGTEEDKNLTSIEKSIEKSHNATVKPLTKQDIEKVQVASS